MACKFHNNSDMDMSDLNPLAKNLMGYMKKKVGFNKPPSALIYQDDMQNSKNILGKTAFYNPNDSSITIFVTGRHPKDILRSLAHELIHHKQNEDGEFDDVGEVGEGYAQSNDKLRGMERQAYEIGNMCFRDWEDGYKNAVLESIYKQQQILRRNKTMDIHKWKNNELNRLLMERFGIKSEKEYNLEEDQDRIFAPNHYCAHHVVYEGQEAYTVDHNWDSKKQQVTKYDIRFKDGSIKRNVPISELLVLEAFTLNEHGGEGNRGKHPPVKDANKDEEDDSDIKNKEKADLDDDGKLSGYEKKRAKAIEKSMNKQAKKKKVDEGMAKKQLAAAAAKWLEDNPDSKLSQEEVEKKMMDGKIKAPKEVNEAMQKKALAAAAVKWLEDNPDSKLSQEEVEKKMMDGKIKPSKDLKESKRDRMFRKKVRLMLESMNLKSNKRKVTVRKRRK